jgi:hypothetical protein
LDHVVEILVQVVLVVVVQAVQVAVAERKKDCQAAAAAAADTLVVVVVLLPLVVQAVAAAAAAAVAISLLQRPQTSQVLLVAVLHLKRMEQLLSHRSTRAVNLPLFQYLLLLIATLLNLQLRALQSHVDKQLR